jgi:primosomal protein N' (replication factor Y)
MLMGPVIPVISKIRDRYLREIYLKINRQHDLLKVKKLVSGAIQELQSQKEYKKTGIIIDVDPI